MMATEKWIFGKNFISLCSELIELPYNMVVNFGEYDFETGSINELIEVTFYAREDDDLDIAGSYEIYPMQTKRDTYILAPENRQVTLDELLTEFANTAKGDGV